jgi:hypothetical protein
MLPALSLVEPWAILMAAGEKAVETRGYPPPPKYLGRRIAIHASKNVPAFAVEAMRSPEIRSALAGARERGLFQTTATGFRIPVGVVLGTVVLADAVRTVDVSWADPGEIEGRWERVGGPGSTVKVSLAEWPFGNFDPGDRAGKPRCAWLTRDVELLPQPYPEATGKLGFWDWNGLPAETGGR